MSDEVTVPYHELSGLENVYLEDSWVLDVRAAYRTFTFSLDLVLTERHLLYSPPLPGEAYCYRKARLIFDEVCSLTWSNDNFRASFDATGEKDFGNIDYLSRKGVRYRLGGGDWGRMEISSASPTLLFDQASLSPQYVGVLSSFSDGNVGRDAGEGARRVMKLKGKRVVVLVADGFEDLEYWVTVMRLREEGAEVISVGPGEGPFNGKNFLEARANATARDVSADELDGIVIPGGWAPDKLRRYEEVTDLVRAVHERGKVVGIICHGGLVAISAGIVHGASATGSLGIKDDLVNAGAQWVDKPAFREGNLVWGRVVPDIPSFCRELVAALSEG